MNEPWTARRVCPSIGSLAVAILLAVSPADAQDGEIIRESKKIMAVATTLAGYYTDVTDVLEVGRRLGEMLGWIERDVTLKEATEKLETQINDVYTGLTYQNVLTRISLARRDAEKAFYNLSRGPEGYVPDETDNEDSRAGARALSNPESWHTVFIRPYDKRRDEALMSLLNKSCTDSKSPEGCIYRKADLYPDAVGDLVYDWSLGLPPLMLFVAYRVQVIAARYPDYFLDPTRTMEYRGLKLELEGYRDALIAHYYRILAGIRCGKYGRAASVCAQIHSLYVDREAGSTGLWGYAVYGDLPLYELQSLIDTLYRYTNPAHPDVTRNYHRLPSGKKPWLCLEARGVEFGPSSVFMNLCDGGRSQQWVYDRQRGTVTNSGSVANPASGECLDVSGGVAYSDRWGYRGNLTGGGELRVGVSPCSAERRQQWTYDPERRVLTSAMGTALAVDWNDLEWDVWTVPGWLVYGPAGGPPVGLRFYDTSTVEWQADGIIPGSSPFSNALAPGEILSKGQSRVSSNNRHELVLQHDGNLVLYEKVADAPPLERAAPVWSSRTSGRAVSHAVMQLDGNLAIYGPGNSCTGKGMCGDFIAQAIDATGPCPLGGPCDGLVPQAIWSSRTTGRPGSHLVVSDDGHVIIYDGATAIWKDGRRQVRRGPLSIPPTGSLLPIRP
jgi:hypothetical protein